MAYSTLLLNYFDQAYHGGEMLSAKGQLIIAQSGSVQQGDAVKFYLDVDGHNVITQIYYQAYGRPAVIAIGSWACKTYEGKAIADLKQLTVEQIMSVFELDSRFAQGPSLIVDAFKKI